VATCDPPASSVRHADAPARRDRVDVSAGQGGGARGLYSGSEEGA